MLVQKVALGVFGSLRRDYYGPLRFDPEPLRHVPIVEALDFLGYLPRNVFLLSGLQSVSFEIVSLVEHDLGLFQSCPNPTCLKLSASNESRPALPYACCTFKGLDKLRNLRTFSLEHQRCGVRVVIGKGLRRLERFIVRCNGRLLFPGDPDGFDELCEGIKHFRVEYLTYERGTEDNRLKNELGGLLAAAKRQNLNLNISGGKVIKYVHEVLGAATHVRYSYSG